MNSIATLGIVGRFARYATSGRVLVRTALLGGTLLLALSFGVAHAEPKTDKDTQICSLEKRGPAAEQSGKCAGAWAVYEGQQVISPDPAPLPESGFSVMSSCIFWTNGDYPHLSSGDVSAHGWWDALAWNDCPSQAYVEVWIQGFWCDGWGCSWLTVAHNEQARGPRNYTGQRTTARRACEGSSSVSFRNVVDVDLIGVSDPADKFWGDIQTLNCTPGAPLYGQNP